VGGPWRIFLCGDHRLLAETGEHTLTYTRDDGDEEDEDMDIATIIFSWVDPPPPSSSSSSSSASSSSSSSSYLPPSSEGLLKKKKKGGQGAKFPLSDPSDSILFEDLTEEGQIDVHFQLVEMGNYVS